LCRRISLHRLLPRYKKYSQGESNGQGRKRSSAKILRTERRRHAKCAAPTDFHFPGEIGRTYLDSDPAQFPKPVQAPEGAPNILLILIADAGFGQFSTFGGGIPSPTMDRLAAEGLRYNHFHTTALCSPTRAALITGRNHHSAAFAGITELATGYDGYTCILPRSCGTIGEVLRQNGYMTAWIGTFKGKFDQGWDAYREETLERQKRLGVVPRDTKLTVRSKGLPAWDSLNAEQKRLYARMMEVFAGYGAHCDYELGRIVDAVKELPNADNTLILYIAGDNGASAEGGLEGSLCENMFFNGFSEKWQDNIKAIDELGGPKHFNHFPSAWAHAMNTPLQWTKQVASHFGGTRNPMIVSWPVRIKDKGGLRTQFLHTIDIVPTLYELCGITAPTDLNGIQQKPIEGISFAFTLDDAEAKSLRKTQYFELGCNRGLYHDGWMASSPSFVPWDPNRSGFDLDKAPWELYKIDEDFSQANDLAQQYPENATRASGSMVG
jgi:arylsulfatase A-like enzyme